MMGRPREENREPDKAGANGGAGEGSFEETLKELEGIAAALEEGGKPLEESLALYERGIKALRRCREILNSAEERMRLLVEKEGGPALEDPPPGAPQDIRRGRTGDVAEEETEEEPE